jgi:membrane-associated phospholipid phosphatase
MYSYRFRITGLIAIVSLQALYFPLNRSIQGGYLPRIPWDDLVPFWPAWSLPYLLSIFWWFACYIWATFKMDASKYRQFLVSTVFMLLSSYVVFILVPTYVERPSADGTGWQYDLIRHIFANDRVNNAFPSGHTYNTVLITLFWWNWYPSLRWLWALITIIVIFSTLFTGQHNLVDPLGGILWAWGGYHFGNWWVARKKMSEVSV